MSNSYGGSSRGDELNENLTHARASYANAQEVIRFVDTKTSVMTGIVTLTTGIPLAVFRYFLLRKPDEGKWMVDWYNSAGFCEKIAVMVAALLMVVGFAFGLASLLASTNGLMSRPPRRAGDKQPTLSGDLWRLLLRTVTFGVFGKREERPWRLTSLFPIFRSEQQEQAVRNFRRLGKGQYDRWEILEEYAAQLESVGGILNIKINRNRRAVEWFERQIFAYLGCVVIALLLMGSTLWHRQLHHAANPKLERLGTRASSTSCP